MNAYFKFAGLFVIAGTLLNSGDADARGCRCPGWARGYRWGSNDGFANLVNLKRAANTPSTAIAEPPPPTSMPDPAPIDPLPDAAVANGAVTCGTTNSPQQSPGGR